MSEDAYGFVRDDELTDEQKAQRVERGYCDADAWNALTWLGRVGAGLCRRLIEEGHGYPAALGDEWPDAGPNVSASNFNGSRTDDGGMVAWRGILTEIAEGFDALASEPEPDDYEAAVAKWKRACELLAEWGFHLWD